MFITSYEQFCTTIFFMNLDHFFMYLDHDQIFGSKFFMSKGVDQSKMSFQSFILCLLNAWANKIKSWFFIFRQFK